MQTENLNGQHADNTLVRSDSAQVTLIRPQWREIKEKIYREQLRKQQSQTPIELAKLLEEKVLLLRTTDQEANLQISRDIATFMRYYECQEYGEYDASGQWVEDVKNDFQYTLPLVAPHVDSAKIELLKTQVEYEYNSKAKDSSIDAELARMCETLAEEDAERAFTDELKAREAINCLIAGKSYRNIFWGVDSSNPLMSEIPKYSMEKVSLNGSFQCGNPECGAVMEEMTENCPNCQSTEITELGTVETTKAVQSWETTKLAENQIHIPNPLAVRHDLSALSLKNSSFLIETDLISRAEAEFLYKQIFPEKKGGISEQQKIIRELERARLKTKLVKSEADRVIKSMFINETPELERERVWLKPYRYANILITENNWYVTKVDGLIQCPTDEMIPNDAQHVPPGTFLGDVFPDGLFICLVDGNLVEINGEKLNEKWLKLIFGMRPNNTDGSGLQRLRFLADMANDTVAMEMAILMEDADPKTFVNRKMIANLAEIGKYNLVDVAEGQSIGEVAKRLEGSSTHPNLAAFNEKINATAQFTAGTFSSFGAGAPDVKAAGTATGVAAMVEAVAGRFLESILLRKVADIEMRYIFLRNRQKFSTAIQIEDYKKRFGSRVVKHFLECSNLERYITVSAKKGTDQPKSKALLIAQMQAYAQASAQIAQLPQGMDIMKFFAEQMDLPIDVGMGMVDREEANRRVGLLREYSKQFNEVEIGDIQAIQAAMEIVQAIITASEKETLVEMLPSPQEMAMTQPPQEAIANSSPEELAETPAMDNPMEEMQEAQQPSVPSIIMLQEHTAFMDVYKDFLLTEAQKLNNVVLIIATQMMWKLHFDRNVIRQNELARLQAEQQKVVQQMLQPAPTPEEMALQAKMTQEQQDRDKEDEAMRMLAEHKLNEDAKQKDFERSELAKDADIERNQYEKDEDLGRQALQNEHQHALASEKEETKEKV